VLLEIELDHFKCFRALTLPLRPLTVLTGVNASGKSTVIQALMLLHQTVVDGGILHPALILDGSVVSLGTLADVVDQVHGRSSFSIGLRSDAFAARWHFGGEGATRRDIAVIFQEGHLTTDDGRLPLGKGDGGLLSVAARATRSGAALEDMLEALSYVCAERSGPREVYPLCDPGRHRTVGTRGELAPGLIHWFGELPVSEGLRLDGPPTLARQTEAWLDHFFSGAGYEVQPVHRANLVTLGLRTSPEEDYHRPQNVGFGLSHLFPILVAVLHARPGDVILVENPEIHLHPRAQAEIGRLLTRAAATGVQIVMETHSDHVLNGVRRAVHDSLVTSEQVAIHFFRPRGRSTEGHLAQVVSPTIRPDGNIDHWPEGFFDQFEIDLGYLAGV
jgi:predicted ATPase